MTDRQRWESIKRHLAEKDDAVRREIATAPQATLTLQAVLETKGEVISASVGPQGQLLVASSSSEPTATDVGQDEGPTWWRFPNGHSTQPYPVVLDVLTSSSRTSLKIPDLPLVKATFQPMPGGEWLAVSSRARFNDGVPDHNAVVFDPVGSLLHTFCIGDAISHVQVSPSGSIRVAYFDEGVFRTWGGPTGSPNPSSAGLSCWSRLGTKEWDFVVPPGLGPIYDCYSLNVVNETAWASYYDGFPIVRIQQDRSISAWPSGEPVHALAIDGGRVVLVGGNSRAHDRLMLFEIDGSALTKVATYRLVLPDGTPVPERPHEDDAGWIVEARGSVIHVADSRWYTLDVSAFGR